MTIDFAKMRKEAFAYLKQHLDMGSLQAPDPASGLDSINDFVDADADDFSHFGGVQFPKNFHKVVDLGNRLSHLSSAAGWKDILDILEAQADEKLRILRESLSTDPVMIKALRDRWVESEDRIRTLESIIINAIKAKDDMMTELSVMSGADPDEIIKDSKTVADMKEALRKEGIIGMSHEEMYQSSASASPINQSTQSTRRK